MQLRNRRTKEEIKFYQGDKIHSFFAGVKQKTQTQEDFFHAFLQDFKERIVNFPQKMEWQEPSFLKTMTTALLQAKLGPLAYVLTPMMLSATSARGPNLACRR